MMRKYLISIFMVLVPESAIGQAKRQPVERFDFSYQYYRIERGTTLNQVDFLSRTGGYFDYSYKDRLSSSFDYYYGFGFGYNLFEASNIYTVNKDYYLPYHAGFGIKLRFGRLRTLRWILGFEGGSEVYANVSGSNEFEIHQTYSGRVKSGFAINFVSMTGANAELEGLFTLPVTDVQFNEEKVRYIAIVDGNLRVKLHQNSSWGLAGKVRFEDYETSTSVVTYFNTRITFGVFFDLND